jgi:hypothetical protein
LLLKKLIQIELTSLSTMLVTIKLLYSRQMPRHIANNRRGIGALIIEGWGLRTGCARFKNWNLQSLSGLDLIRIAQDIPVGFEDLLISEFPVCDLLSDT